MFAWVFACGASVGVSCWLRANAMLLAPFLALLVVPLLFPPGSRLRPSVALLAGALVVVGTLTLRLTNAVDNPEILVAAELKNRATPYTGGQIVPTGGTPLDMGDPEIKTGITVFSLKTNISSALAALMIDNPDLFVATFFTSSGPAARGTLRLGQPVGR